MILPSLLLAVVASAGDAGAIDSVIRNFFSAYAGGDAARATSYWTGAEREAFASEAKVVFRARCMKLDAIDVEVAEITNDAARADVTAKITAWHDMPGGTPHPLDERRTVRLVKSADGWRISHWSRKEDDVRARVEAASDRELPAVLAALPRTPAMVTALAHAANAASNRHDVARANLLVETVYAIAVDTGDAGAIATALGAQSTSIRILGTLKASERSAADALAFAEASGDADVLANAILRHGRATPEDNVPLRRALFRRSLELADHLTDLSIAAIAASQLAITSHQRGDYREEMQFGRLALAYAEASGNRTAMLSALLNIGGCYYHQADWELAASHYRRALALAHELRYPASEVGLLLYLARCHEELGDDERAAALRDEALKVAEESTCWPGAIALVRTDRAVALLKRGKPAEAEKESVAALHDALLAGGSNAIGAARLAYAEAALRQGRFEEARSIAEQEGYPHTCLPTAIAYQRLGAVDEATRYLRSCIDWIEHSRERILADHRQQERFLANSADIYLALVDVLVDGGKIEEAYATATRLKGRVLRELLAGSEAPGLSADRDLAEEKHLTHAIEQLNTTLLETSEPVRIASARAELDLVRTQLADLISRTRGTEAEYRVLQDDATAIDFTGELADALVLDYVVGKERITVFVARRNQPVIARTIPIGRDALAARVRQLRSAIEQRNLRFGAISKSLHELLLAPVKKELAAARLVCIIPSGALWNVPFHALQDRNGKYEIEKHAVVYAPTPALLRASGGRMKAKPTLLAFGNPNIRAETVTRFRSLDPRGTLGAIPEVEDEVRRVAALYEHGRAYIGEEARESVLKAVGASYDVLHIASHGLVDDRSPMFSALVLSKAPGEEEDGLLEAREIAGMKLGTRLAVLSACETGRGQISSGEGVIGLSWALLAAGCPTAVVSQWKAVSSTTATMMVDFHRRLVQGVSTPEALRSAQLALRRDPQFAHPFYWAPFVVVGAPR